MIEILLFVLVLLSVALMGHYFYQRIESTNQKMSSVMALVSTMANEMQLMRTKVNLLELQQKKDPEQQHIFVEEEEPFSDETFYACINHQDKQNVKEECNFESTVLNDTTEMSEYKLIEVSDDEDEDEDDDDDNNEVDFDEAIDTDEKLRRRQSMNTQQHMLDFLQSEMFRTFHPVSRVEGLGFGDVGIMSFGIQVSNDTFSMQSADDRIVSDLIQSLSFIDGSDTMVAEEPIRIHQEEGEEPGPDFDLLQSVEELDKEESLSPFQQDQTNQNMMEQTPRSEAWSFIDEDVPLPSIVPEASKVIHVGESEEINVNQVKKLSLPKLRDLAKSKGLVEDSSNKLKKTELLKLFGI